MNSIIFKEEITENNYQDFIHQIIDIFRLSNYQKYIMFSLKIEKEECIIRMSILNHDGANQEYEDIVMNSTTSYFSSFLHLLIQELREHCEIVKEDIVNVNDKEVFAFRMITEFNDLITIDGLTEEKAKELLKEKGNPMVELSMSNNAGGSNILGFLFMIIVLVLSIIGVVMIVD